VNGAPGDKDSGDPRVPDPVPETVGGAGWCESGVFGERGV